jgi:putative MATE family efflux protein
MPDSPDRAVPTDQQPRSDAGRTAPGEPATNLARRHDREILRLAVPALGALTAEPIYVLVDTAIVGHLGTHSLGGLGVAGTVLTTVFGVFNFLAYGTTAAVARRIGAGDRKAAVEQGLAGVWLAVGLGAVLTGLGLLFAGPIVDAMGASADVRPYALTYLRISLLGAPMVTVMLAGVGYLRGVQDGRTPFVIAVAANVANLALEVLFVYGFGWGISGSAWGTVLAQTASAIAYVVIAERHRRAHHARRRPDHREIIRTARVGSHLVVRTASLLAAFTVTTAIASRISDTAIAAHQVAFQLWYFLALALDAIAIAGQSIVGRYLGADDAPGARSVTRRMLQLGTLAGIVAALVVVAGRGPLAALFTDDRGVRSAVEAVLPIVALWQPIGAIVFVLDGILIGAGETRYLAIAMVAATFAFLPAAALVVSAEAGLVALWWALGVFLVARLIGMYARYRGDDWLVTGATRT